MLIYKYDSIMHYIVQKLYLNPKHLLTLRLFLSLTGKQTWQDKHGYDSIFTQVGKNDKNQFIYHRVSQV